MGIEFCLYGTKGRSDRPPYPEYLDRKRTDNGTHLIKKVCLSTTWDSVVPDLRRSHPHLKDDIVALCDPGCVYCLTVEDPDLRYAGPSPGIDQPGRLNSNPDMSITQAAADHVRAGYPDAYWRNRDGMIACPQTNDAQWHPLGENLLWKGQMRNVLEVWVEEAARLTKTGPMYSAIMADCHAGTWLSYGGIWQQMGLSLEAWRKEWSLTVRSLKALGVKIGENCYGPGGPRNSDEPNFCKVETMWRHGGTRNRYAKYGYVANTTAYGKYVQGLPLMTIEQAAQSIMTVSPFDNETLAEQFELVKASLAVAQLYDIGFVSMQEKWGGEWWDAHALWPAEIEQWTRLIPSGPTVWRTWRDSPGVLDELPDAPACLELGDVVGYRDMVDPIGGQTLRIWLNPSGQTVFNMPPGTAKLV